MTMVRNASDVAATLAAATLATGGATVCGTVNGPAVPTTGYMVGGVVPPITIPLADLTRHGLEAAVSTLLPHTVLRSGRASQVRFIGAWVHEGAIHLDVSEHVAGTLVEALSVGLGRGELAVWDIAKGESVETGADVPDTMNA